MLIQGGCSGEISSAQLYFLVPISVLWEREILAVCGLFSLAWGGLSGYRDILGRYGCSAQLPTAGVDAFGFSMPSRRVPSIFNLKVCRASSRPVIL